MHRSRLGAIVIDCRTEGDLEREAQFWSRALGCEVKRSEDPDNASYVRLETPPGEVQLLLQRVGHDSRVHIDIEADDQEAEVRRLESLGAKRIARIKRWWVLEAPSGHRFCVVEPQRSTFERDANRWE